MLPPERWRLRARIWRRYLSGIAGQHAQLGERVEDEALGTNLIHLAEDVGDGVGELDFRGMEDGVLGLRFQVFFRGNHLEDFEAVGAPAVGAGDLFELVARLRKGDVEGSFPIADALEEELEGEGGFAGAGVAFDEVEVALGESAKKDVVEAGDAGPEATGGRSIIRAGSMAVRDGVAGPGGIGLRVHLFCSPNRGLHRRDAEGQRQTRNFDAEGKGCSCPGGRAVRRFRKRGLRQVRIRGNGLDRGGGRGWSG